MAEIAEYLNNVLNKQITLSTALITVTTILIICLVIYYIYSLTRTITSPSQLPKNYKLTGVVIRVGDGDGFRIVHKPLLRRIFCGNNSDSSLSVRLAGVDAPEVAAFGKPAQPGSSEARDFLKKLIYKKQVTVHVLGVDMYNRVLGIVYIYKYYIFRTNINILMVESGHACVYDRGGAEYGEIKENLIAAERRAKNAKVGIWKDKNMILPMDYKKKYKK